MKADQFVVFLKQFGLKKTRSRIAVLEIFFDQKKPLDVLAIISLLRQKRLNTNYVTVYRILDLFHKNGIINRIEFQEGKFRYELAKRQHHHHLICESCGRIDDVADELILKLEGQITKNKKFIVKKHALEFFGLCFSCQNKKLPKF